jgi:hypothetical protein
MNHILVYIASPPQKDASESNYSYSIVMDATSYTTCLHELQGYYDSYGVYQLGIQQAYQDCVRGRIPNLESLPFWRPGERTCVGGGGKCGDPGDGELPNVTYGFPPFYPPAAAAAPAAKPFFPGGLPEIAFEPDLTTISTVAWANHSETALDVGRAQRRMLSSVPSYYGTSLGGYADDDGGEPNYYSTRVFEEAKRKVINNTLTELARATKTASASATTSKTASPSATTSRSSRPTRTATETATATATPSKTPTQSPTSSRP